MNPLTKIKNSLNNRRIKQQEREEAVLQEVKRRKQEFELSKQKTKEEKSSELQKQDEKTQEAVDYLNDRSSDTKNISETKETSSNLIAYDEIDLDKIVDELKMNAWTNSGNCDKYLIVCHNVIGFHGYVIESSYEYFEPACSISLNDTLLYGETSRCISSYRNETYAIGKFKNLDKALDFLSDFIGDKEITIQMEKPEIKNTYQIKYDLSEYCLPDDVIKFINEYGFAIEEKDGVIKLSLPHKNLNAPDLHKSLHCEEIKGTGTYNYAVNPDLKMIMTSENSSYNRKTELQIFDTKEKFNEGVKAVEKTQEITETREDERRKDEDEDWFQMTGQYPNDDYDLDDIDI